MPSPAYGPTHTVDGNGPLTQVCNAYAEVPLERASITKNDLPQTGANLQTYLLHPSGKVKSNDHGSKGPKTGQPRPDNHPNLNLLVECHTKLCFLTLSPFQRRRSCLIPASAQFGPLAGSHRVKALLTFHNRTERGDHAARTQNPWPFVRGHSLEPPDTVYGFAPCGAGVMFRRERSQAGHRGSRRKSV